MSSNGAGNKPRQKKKTWDDGSEEQLPFEFLEDVGIEDLRQKRKENGQMISTLDKFKTMKTILIEMARKDFEKEHIVTSVVQCIGVPKEHARTFADRLKNAYPKPQSNST